MARDLAAVFRPETAWCECGRKLVELGFLGMVETIEATTGKHGAAPIMMRADGGFVWVHFCTECGNPFFDLETVGGNIDA